MARLIAVTVFFVQPAQVWGLQPTGTSAGEQGRDALVVELSTDKKEYKLGEPIMVTVVLRIRGEAIFWVSDFRGISREAGSFMLDVFDEKNYKLKGQFIVADGLPSPSDEEEVDVVSEIMRTRDLLGPGDFFGFTRSLKQCGYSLPGPGRYRLQASFHDRPLSDLASPEQIEQAKSREGGWILKFPVWSGRVESPPVWIRVVPQAPRIEAKDDD